MSTRKWFQSSVNDLYMELAFPVQHYSNYLYLKQRTALLGYKLHDILCFSSVEAQRTALLGYKLHDITVL